MFLPDGVSQPNPENQRTYSDADLLENAAMLAEAFQSFSGVVESERIKDARRLKEFGDAGLTIDGTPVIVGTPTERVQAQFQEAQDKLGQSVRWHRLALDHIQQGLMCLRRSIERPDGF